MSFLKRIIWFVVVLIATGIPPRLAFGHGGDMEGAPPATDSGPPQPYDDPLNFWPFNIHRNPTPAEVEKRREELRSKAKPPVGETKFRDDIKQVEKELACIDLEYEIARKRDERDTMRNDGRKDQAGPLDREIHDLKEKLARCRASLSTPVQPGPAPRTSDRK